MKKPSLKTRFLGSPVVVLPTTGFFLWSGYTWLIRPETWPVAAAALFILAWVMKANEQRHAYRVWKRTWDGMAGQAPRRRNVFKPLTVMMAFVAAALYLVATFDRIKTQTGLGLMVIGGIGTSFFFVVRALFRRRAQRKPANDDLVRVCIRKPLLPVPTLQQAYAALPDHCRAVMGGR